MTSGIMDEKKKEEQPHPTSPQGEESRMTSGIMNEKKNNPTQPPHRGRGSRMTSGIMDKKKKEEQPHPTSPQGEEIINTLPCGERWREV